MSSRVRRRRSGRRARARSPEGFPRREDGDPGGTVRQFALFLSQGGRCDLRVDGRGIVLTRWEDRSLADPVRIEVTSRALDAFVSRVTPDAHYLWPSGARNTASSRCSRST